MTKLYFVISNFLINFILFNLFFLQNVFVSVYQEKNNHYKVLHTKILDLNICI